MNRNKNHSKSMKPLTNEFYVEDMNFAMKHTRWFFRAFGIWPLVATNSSAIDKFAGKILEILCPVSILLILVPIVIYIAIKNPKINEIIIFFPPIVYTTSNFFKYLIVTLRVNSVKTCYRHMEMDWKMLENEKDRQIMTEAVEKVHKVTFWSYSGMLVVTPLYWLVGPLYSPKTVINEFNETVKALTNPGSNILADTRVNVKYEIVLCSNFYSGLFNIIVGTGMWNLCAIFVGHACGQITIVLSKLEDLNQPDNTNSNFENNRVLYNRIGIAIRHHARLLEFGKKIDSILQQICFIEVFSETVIISSLGYSSVMGWKSNDLVAITTYVPVLVLYAFNLFVYCEVGEYLKEKSVGVGNAAYFTEWHRLPVKIQLALIMVINMGSTPQKITAGGIIEMSRFSYSQVMKTAFAYLNMLNSV